MTARKLIHSGIFFIGLQMMAFVVLAGSGSDEVKKVDLNNKAASFRTITVDNDDAGNIIVNWSTLRPIQPGETFIIERSIDGIAAFKAIGSVKANSSTKYKFVDQLPAMGTAYYRIKRQQATVTLATSDVRYITVFFAMKSNTIEIFTNKQNGEAVIQYYSLYPEIIHLKLTDKNNEVMEFDRAIKKGMNVMMLNLDLLRTGTYQLDIQSSQGYFASVINFEN